MNMKMTLSCAMKFVALFALVTAFTLFPTFLAAQTVTQISNSGTIQPIAAPATVSGLQNPETDAGLAGNDSDDDLGIDLQGNVFGNTALNRSIAAGPGQGANAAENSKAKSNPEIIASFDGLNFFNQRFANHGQSILRGPAGPGIVRRQWFRPGIDE